jgi:large subunit ribosomal protein L4
VFGPHPRSYHQALPRKMRRLALRSALSDKAAADSVIVVDDFGLEDARTKTLMSVLAALGVEGSAIVVLPQSNERIRLASGNLRDVHVALPNGLSLLDVLQANVVVFDKDAVESVTRQLLGESVAASGAA